MAAGGASEHFLLEIVECKDVPKSDLLGHSDPYVVGWFSRTAEDSTLGKIASALSSDSASPDVLEFSPSQEGVKRSGRIKKLLKLQHPFTRDELNASLKQKKGPKIRTERMYNAKDPAWHCVRDFYMAPDPGDLLVLVLYDWDPGNPDDLLGATAIPAALLAPNRLLSVELTLFNRQTRGLGSCSLTLRRLSTPDPYPWKKTLFLIRHGESQWNEAQEKKKLGSMVKTTDHGLNIVGISQARGFNSRWRAAPRDGRVVQFMAAADIWVSPLTRAVQTSLLTLDGHPTLASQGVKLLPSMREAKNLGGLDTIGRKCGADIEKRVRSQFEKVVPPAERPSLPLGYRIDHSRCAQPWWTPKGIKEGQKVIARRLFDFATVVQHSPADVVICVGHSLFFKQFVTNYMSDALRQAKPDLAAKMVAHKLGNACCLAVDVAYSSDEKAPVLVTDAELMFGSDFLVE